MTSTDLKAKANSRLESALRELLRGGDPFPVEIPYRRPSRTGAPATLLQVKAMLKRESKAERGFGPTVQFEEVNTRKFGSGSVPGKIMFDTLDDLVRYVGRKPEADRILRHAGLVVASFPAARDWTATRLRKLGEETPATWEGVVTAVSYFRDHPSPWVYPREIPLGLPTKFLESHQTLVIDLLGVVAPASLNPTYHNWQDRLGLRSSSDMIEGRFLDPALAPTIPQHMTAPAAEWSRCAFASLPWILVIENRTTFLSLPPLRGCLALLGKGYAVNRLAGIAPLSSARLVYWGDIDQHGFEILSLLRKHLSHVESFLMDEQTLRDCADIVATEDVEPTLSPAEVEPQLTDAERPLWKRCQNEHLRLEQELIPTNYCRQTLQRLAERIVTS